MADNKDDLLSPDEIEALFESARGQDPATAPPARPGSPAPQPPAAASAEPRVPAATAAPPEAPALLQPDDISELIRQHAASQRSRPSPAAAAPTARPSGETAARPPGERPTAADALLEEMEANLAAAVRSELPGTPTPAEAESALPFDFQEFQTAADVSERMPLKTLEDVELEVRIELGRAEMLIDDVLKLREGAVVPLDKLAGDPVDILVNGRLIARGEVLVLNDNFCVRVAEILNSDL
jgi:flagellar motor switch protein FliN